MCDYARDAAHAAINKKLDKSQLIFAKNDSGSNDVSMFDFTSLYQAVNSSRIVEKHGHKLFLSLVGDSLVEVNKIYLGTRLQPLRDKQFPRLFLWQKRDVGFHRVLFYVVGLGSI